MTTRKYQGIKYTANYSESTLDDLTLEGALQINVNEKPFTMTMRTPGDDLSLIRGLLHSEGVIRDQNYAPEVSIQESDKITTKASVIVDPDALGEGYSNSRTLLSVSSCGICGKTELDDTSCEKQLSSDNDLFEAEMIEQMMQVMSGYQKTFEQSGGSHAAAAFDKEGGMMTCMEDIGRHNAVDKVIGALINKGELREAKFLLVSGRISYEIVIKCFKARIPVLAAVSAPSSLAVDYAKELGITLLAFCRNNRATCYANTERIRNINLKNQAS